MVKLYSQRNIQTDNGVATNFLHVKGGMKRGTMIQPRSLQQRTFFFIIIPTFVLLLVLSFSGFILVRNVLLKQWGETALTHLQRTAHLIDMELKKPKELLSIVQQETMVSRKFFKKIVKQVEDLESVLSVEMQWPKHSMNMGDRRGEEGTRGGRYRFERFKVGALTYNQKLNDRTVSLLCDFTNNGENSQGGVEIVFSFDRLIEQVLAAPWWKSNKAYFIDEDGNVLASTGLQTDLEDYYPMRAFGTVSKLEKDTMNAMLDNRSGTVFGPGSPPSEISGYYRLSEAPWTMVVIASGESVLQPIIQFRFVYVLSFTLCILVILLFIRTAMGRVTSHINLVSSAADELSKGRFGPPLQVESKDEVGKLTDSFNKMSRQLRQRLAMKEAIDVARDVQQNLLPQSNFKADGLAVEGTCLYCDETGGDYYDILRFSDSADRVAVVVADVVGHGLGAALLMSSVRAMLRCRVGQPGSQTDIIGDVNDLLCEDTRVTGNFVTLFYLEIDRRKRCIEWVRAGHEPALVYSVSKKKFSSLKGRGIALGVESGLVFQSSTMALSGEELIILIGSDGAWEVENSEGEQFGKKRIQDLIALWSHLSPEEIILHITQEIALFRGEEKQNDDITLMIVKTA